MYLRLTAALIVLVAAAVLWLATPPGTFSVEGVTALLAPLREHWWGPLATTAGMIVALLLFAPMSPMVAALVLAHGPGTACVVGWVATVLAAAIGHGVGRFLLRESLEGRLVRAMPSLAGQLTRRSLRATLLIRMMPAAPFSVMNVLAGAAGVPGRYFVAGTGLVALPIVIVMAWLSEGILRALRATDPARAAMWLAVAVVTVALLWLANRWLRRR